MKEREIEIPVLAVGGINIEDTEQLLQTGIHGIAVSASVNLADEPAEAFKGFYKKIY
jgi:thiamine-phosphate pyrophosphorylase